MKTVIYIILFITFTFTNIDISHSDPRSTLKPAPYLIDWVYEHSTRISRKMAKEIVEHVSYTAYPLFLLSLMKTESSFDPTNLSKAGAMGLGQVMPDHEKTLIKAGIIKEMRDVYDIPAGVKATELIWKLKLRHAKGNIETALQYYYGARCRIYINGILKDYDYLRGLRHRKEGE